MLDGRGHEATIAQPFEDWKQAWGVLTCSNVPGPPHSSEDAEHEEQPFLFLALERRIAADERGGIIHRWQYGRELLKAKAGRRKLPDGFLDDRIAEAEHEGHTISRQEIQRRIRCAEVYGDDRQLRQAADAIGSWSALVNAGFPRPEPVPCRYGSLTTAECGHAEQWVCWRHVRPDDGPVVPR